MNEIIECLRCGQIFNFKTEEHTGCPQVGDFKDAGRFEKVNRDRSEKFVEKYPDFNGREIEYIAELLRIPFYNYISLESALYEYGIISQSTGDRLTVVTTGPSGEFKTFYGVIEFTNRDNFSIYEETINKGWLMYYERGRPILLASRWTAHRDLKIVNRNLHLVDMDKFKTKHNCCMCKKEYWIEMKEYSFRNMCCSDECFIEQNSRRGRISELVDKLEKEYEKPDQDKDSIEEIRVEFESDFGIKMLDIEDREKC